MPTTPKQPLTKERHFDKVAQGAEPPFSGVVPVFDRASHDPVSRTAPNAEIGFQRTERDRRPGKPLPPEATGDPHPDRLALAEARRQAILRQEARYRIEGSSDAAEALCRAPSRRATPARSSTPDIEKPRGYYINILPEDAAVEARRGGEVLYFGTVSDAARGMTGERSPKWAKAIQNAAGGITKTAFGWEWTRLKSRKGRNR